MIHCKAGEVMLRICPPTGQLPGFAQACRVHEVTEDTIVLIVQADFQRAMVFDRPTGKDREEQGFFIVRPDTSPDSLPATTKQRPESDAPVSHLAADIRVRRLTDLTYECVTNRWRLEVTLAGLGQATVVDIATGQAIQVRSMYGQLVEIGPDQGA